MKNEPPVSADRISVLFVCLGNICRSPLAEGIFLHKINQRGLAHRFRVDSAGLGSWHVGECADPRSLAVARKYGVTLPSRARVVHPRDFTSFDHIIAMDHENVEGLLARGAPEVRVKLLLEFDPGHRLREVPDPYTAGPEAFETIYTIIDRACEHLLNALLSDERK